MEEGESVLVLDVTFELLHLDLILRRVLNLELELDLDKN